MNSPRNLSHCLAVAILLLVMPEAGVAAPADEEVPAPVLAILQVAAEERDGGDFVEIAVLVARAQPAHAAAVFAAARRLEPGADAALVKAAAEFASSELASGGTSEKAGAVSASTSIKNNSVKTTSAETTSGPATSDKPNFLDLGAWDGGVEFGMSTSSGNTEEQAFALALELKRVISKRWDHKLEFDADYARRLGLTSKERYAGHYELFYRGWERSYLYAFLAGERDRFSAFDYRITESIGAGYQIFDGPRQKWSIEGGPGLRQTKLNTVFLGSEPATGSSVGNEFIAVLSSDYEFRLSEGLSFSNKTKVFVGEARTTLANEAGLKARLNGALSARLTFDLKYDSEVLAGAHHTDTLTRATIVYDF